MPWYTPYVLRCYAAGIMVGSNGMANPDAAISRQEAMTMLCRALSIAPVKDADLSAYTDGGAVASWAAPYVAALTKTGIVNGVGGKRLAPQAEINRASVMTVLDRAVVQYINTPGSYELTDKAGIVLVAAGDVTLTGTSRANVLVTPAADSKELTFDKAVITGTITVQADNAKVVTANGSKLPNVVMTGVGSKVEESKPTSNNNGGGSSSGGGGGSSTPTYGNLVVSESKNITETTTYQDVTITDAVGNGTVTLANLTIRGNLYINGGGSNSIKLENCVILGRIIFNKIVGGDAQIPSVKLTNTPVPTVVAQKPGIIEALDNKSAVTSVTAQANVEIKGTNTTVAAITVPADAEAAVEVKVTAGAVAKVEAKSETSVTGAANAVAQVVAEAPVTVAANAVEMVEVPSAAPANVTVAVTGSGTVDVAVNSENGAAITTGDGGATVTVSSELETTPPITVDGENKHIHKWNEGEVTKAATCTVAGLKTYTCTAEGCDTPVATKAENIPALGHDFSVWQSDIGMHWHKCSRCEVTDTPASHNFGDSFDCTKAAVCAVCAYERAAESTHKTVVQDDAVPATCTEAGKSAGSHCTYCNKVITAQETVAALGHDFTGVYQSDADGHWHKCTRCDVTDTKATHTYPAGVSCDAAANCTACSYEKAAGAHTWGDWVKADAANHSHTCSVCKTTATAAHDWDEGKVTTEPTETTEGVRTFTCSVCKGTKTETLPVVNSKLIWASAGRLSWDAVDGASKYRVKILDGNGKTIYNTMVTQTFIDLSAQAFRFGTGGTYNITVSAVDSDNKDISTIGTLSNAIVAEVSGSEVSFTYEILSEKTYSLTLSDNTPNGHRVWQWATSTSANIDNRSSSNGLKFENQTRYYAFQDGDIITVCVLTRNEITGSVWNITMTPASTQTYNAPTVTTK